MNGIKSMAALSTILLLSLCPRSASACDRLEKATADQLVSYLAGIMPKEQDAKCIVFAIDELGEKRYQPAIPALKRWLFLRWPLNARRLQIRDAQPGSPLAGRSPESFGLYPAVDALEKIGRSALPSVLEAIKASDSERVREAALSVWMYFYKNDAPAGVALLKQEADRTTDLASKKRLSRAALRAAAWCSRSEEGRCRAVVAGP